MSVSPLELALSYTSLSWPVFPCRSTDEVTDEYDSETGELVVLKAKTPLVSNGFRGATLSERIVRELWKRNPDAAVGIPTGTKTGVFVLDIDVKGDVNGFDWLHEQESIHGALPATATVDTPSGGVHFYFRYVEGTRNRGALGAGVDLRSEGGYVLAPGSVMATGKTYAWRDHDGAGIPEIADAPQWLLDLVVRKEQPASTPGIAPRVGAMNSAYVNRAVQNELDDLADTPRGNRNNALNDAAFSIGQFVGSGGLQESEARQMLRDVALSWGRDQALCFKTIENGLRAGINAPREIPEPMYHDEMPADPEMVRRFIENSKAKNAAAGEPANDNVTPKDDDESVPVDPWAEAKRPSLPIGLLPKVVEDYALVLGEFMGASPGGIATAALAVCAAAIPDTIKIRVKKHDEWEQSARLWVALIGDPSSKKSPIISAVTKPLNILDTELVRQYNAAIATYMALPNQERFLAKAPRQKRLRLEDTTVEAAQEVLKDSPDGLLLVSDELSGFFGAMDKYSGGKGGAAKDRAFWLTAFNGGSYAVNRVGRGATLIENLSVCLLGGIQPEPMKRVSEGSADDGLLQRVSPVMLGQAAVGKDEAFPPVAERYRDLIFRLNKLSPPKAGLGETVLKFDDEAQAFRSKLEVRHHEMVAAYEAINKKLAGHIGKYDGIFARLCVIWQCVESDGARPEIIVTLETAERVGRFLHEFLFPHAFAFYSNVLGLTERHDALLATAGFILTHCPERIDARTVRRGDRLMRNLKDWEAEQVLSQLDALGWLTQLPLKGNEKSQKWAVRPAVHELFAEKARAERIRRAAIRDLIAEAAAA